MPDTIAAIATPQGEGGVGIIRITGPEAEQVAQRIFRGRPLDGLPTHRPTLGKAVDPDTGEMVDRVLVTLFRAPNSYTGEVVAEISGHGGTVGMRRLLDLCLKNGARLARPGEFTERAFLNGRIDLAQAEAVADTIRARTATAHRIAVHQLEGRLSNRLSAVRGALLGLMAHVEASIDFPDDVDEPNRGDLDEALAAAIGAIERLLQTADAGRIYREGVAVAIAGKPNVGKSSLMNALLRDARAIVTDVPGTTRDLLEESLNLDGVPLRIVDTAGLRATEDPVERIGVERALSTLKDADIVILVLDRSRPLDEQDGFARAAIDGRVILPVVNKCDLPAVWEPNDAAALLDLRELGSPQEISLARDEGLEALERAIVETALGGRVEPVEIWVTQARHRASLEAAFELLTEARLTLDRGHPLDLVVNDVKAAADRLAEITGERVTESVITEIFARFCVGK